MISHQKIRPLIGRPERSANQSPVFLAGNLLNSCPDWSQKKLTLAAACSLASRYVDTREGLIKSLKSLYFLLWCFVAFEGERFKGLSKKQSAFIIMLLVYSRIQAQDSSLPSYTFLCFLISLFFWCFHF